MFQEIKYQLFKLFLIQKKKLFLFSCLVFFGLFAVAQITHAFALDLASVQLDALDFIDNTVLKYLVSTALIAIESVAFLNISAGLLDWSSRLPVMLDNPLVDAGWQFTSGLTNIAFILILIAIALAYVFNLETFGMKKALPKLIIIAFLINFSLLFVKMFSDVGWIIQNSFGEIFFQDGGGFATAAASALTKSSRSLAGVVIGVPLAYMVVAGIPYINVIALAAVGALVLKGALISTISQIIMMIVLNFVVGFVFLVFAALFLVRIAAIWLLAILAPLAFMAYILPSTQKYFKQWRDALMQWALLGVVAFFFLGLGLTLFGLVAPGAEQVGSFGDLGKFSDVFYKYVFLIIYMVVVLGICKKFVPASAQAVWSLTETMLNKTKNYPAKLTRWGGKKLAVGWEQGTQKTALNIAAKGGKPNLYERWRIGAIGRKMDSDEALKIGIMAEAKEKKLTESRLAEEKAKVLKTAPKEAEDRRNYLQAELIKEGNKNITKSLDKIAAIMDILTKEGRIGKVEEKFIVDAVKKGVDPNKILARRPDLAPKLSTDKTIKDAKVIEDVMNKMNPEDIKKTQVEAFKDINVVMHALLDKSKLDELTKGKREIKQQIINTFNNTPAGFMFPSQHIPTMQKNINEIANDPRWPKF